MLIDVKQYIRTISEIILSFGVFQCVPLTFLYNQYASTISCSQVPPVHLFEKLEQSLSKTEDAVHIGPSVDVLWQHLLDTAESDPKRMKKKKKDIWRER